MQRASPGLLCKNHYDDLSPNSSLVLRKTQELLAAKTPVPNPVLILLYGPMGSGKSSSLEKAKEATGIQNNCKRVYSSLV